jgi:hypothetical protein
MTDRRRREKKEQQQQQAIKFPKELHTTLLPHSIDNKISPLFYGSDAELRVRLAPFFLFTLLQREIGGFHVCR